jgi:deoxyribodipyrimidine photolyase-related protein
MEASEWRGRRFQQTRLADSLGTPVTLLPNSQFLVTQFDPYPEAKAGKRVIMEHFYRRMRRHFRILLTPGGKPIGGRWTYDAENRKPLPRGARPPSMPVFPPDAITQEVMSEVETAGHGMGTAAGFELAVTR